MASDYLEDWRAALRLRDSLEAGHIPLTRFNDVAAEATYCSLACRCEELVGAPLALANSDPRTHAAAMNWRHLGTGTLVLSQFRLWLAESPDISFGWDGLQRLWAEPGCLRLAYGSRDFRLVVHCPVWLSVMVFIAAFHAIPELHPPQHVIKELGG